MAVTTRINEFPTWYGGGKKPSLFGYPVPENVKAVDHSFNVLNDNVIIAWATFDYQPDRPWHQMEMSMPVTEEKITALLIAMKLTC